MGEFVTNPAPFCKWAGGKGQLLTRIADRMPDKFKHYYEPFVGAGAVVLGLTPENAHINDINGQLINTYMAVRDNPTQLMMFLDELDNGFGENAEEHYYSVRTRFNGHLSTGVLTIETAAMFVFLNKHCFNGLYRVNTKGLFNVPYNRSKRPSYSRNSILATSQYLSTVTISHGDFEMACQGASAGDFVFFDSPYAPLNETSFESYTKEGFEKEEHIRLSKLFKELDAHGCKCMLTNHNTSLVNELYHDYNIEVVQVKRMINSKANNRKGEEVIVRNYD